MTKDEKGLSAIGEIEQKDWRAAYLAACQRIGHLDLTLEKERKDRDRLQKKLDRALDDSYTHHKRASIALDTLFLVRSWEKIDREPDWAMYKAEIVRAIHEAQRRYKRPEKEL